MRVESSVPQSPAQQLPSSPVLPAENAAGLAAPSGAAPQQTQQQVSFISQKGHILLQYEANFREVKSCNLIIALSLIHRLPRFCTCYNNPW